jgi:hypothetical protein
MNPPPLLRYRLDAVCDADECRDGLRVTGFHEQSEDRRAGECIAQLVTGQAQHLLTQAFVDLRGRVLRGVYLAGKNLMATSHGG